MSAPPVFRFAPSPNGRLHLGHAYSVLLNQSMARACGGRLLLRLEDIDQTRCRPEFEAEIVADLDWLGIGFDGPPIRQSLRLPAHQRALGSLQDRDLVYPCFCSRGDIVRAIAGGQAHPHDPDGKPLYPGTCRDMPDAERRARLARGEPFAVRLDVQAALAQAPRDLHWIEIDRDLSTTTVERADPAAWGDVVLARKESPTSYHLAVVLDDAAREVTHVVRGRDLMPSTSVHALLQHLLGTGQPLYHHHALIRGPDGGKLSKSTGSTGLSELRAAGWTPEDVAAEICALTGASRRRRGTAARR